MNNEEDDEENVSGENVVDFKSIKYNPDRVYSDESNNWCCFKKWSGQRSNECSCLVSKLSECVVNNCCRQKKKLKNVLSELGRTKKWKKGKSYFS